MLASKFAPDLGEGVRRFFIMRRTAMGGPSRVVVTSELRTLVKDPLKKFRMGS